MNMNLLLLALAALSLSVGGIVKKSIVLQIAGQCLGMIALFLILNNLFLHGG